METLMKSEQIANRLILLSSLKNLTFDDELKILNHLVHKFNFKTLSNYAKENNISYNGVKKMVDENRIQHFIIDGNKYIF